MTPIEKILVVKKDDSRTEQGLVTRLYNAMYRIGRRGPDGKPVPITLVEQLAEYRVERHGPGDFGFVHKASGDVTRPMQFGEGMLKGLQERLKAAGFPELEVTRVGLKRKAYKRRIT